MVLQKLHPALKTERGVTKRNQPTERKLLNPFNLIPVPWSVKRDPQLFVHQSPQFYSLLQNRGTHPS